MQLARKLSEREAMNALRSLKGLGGLVDFSSNDYLGLARNEAVSSWAGQLVTDAYPMRNGAAGSRLLTGNHKLYLDLESLLEQVYGAPALVFNSGYDANMGFFASIPQRGDLVLYDEYVHASIRDGIRMGLAKGYKFRHNDLEDLQLQLRRHNKTGNAAEVYVVTESVFSMDGDSPRLHEMLAFCAGHDCRLVVDEAHALGVCGKGPVGLVQHLGLEKETFARILTFGKAMGAHGAAVVGSAPLKDYLVNFARSFVYTTALPPHAVATLLGAYHYIVTESGNRQQQKLLENVRFFREQLALMDLQAYFTDSQSAIQCCLLPGNSHVKEAAGYLQGNGFDVRPILSPTVPEGSERLRFCLHSFNSENDIRAVLGRLVEFIKPK